MKDLFNILNPLPNLKLVYSNRSLLKQLVKRIIAAKYHITDDYSMLRVKTDKKDEYYLEDANLILHKPYKSKR